MRDEAIALWHKLEAKQRREMHELSAIHKRQRDSFGPLMQYACDIDVTNTVEDLARKSEESFQQLREGLEALSQPYETQPPVAVGTSVNFDPGSKPYMQ